MLSGPRFVFGVNSMILIGERAEVAEQVRRQVRSYVGPAVPLYSACAFFAYFTVLELAKRGVRGIVQAGTHSWPIVPEHLDDGQRTTHLSYEWEPDSLETTVATGAGALPEMHCWAAIPATQEIIDLTTSYLPDRAKASRIPWLTPAPPEFVWATAAQLPARVVYRPCLKAIRVALKILAQEFS